MAEPMTTRVILQAVVPQLEKSPRLDRVRNDIASRLTAIPVAKASSSGLRLLSNLLASSPSMDSEDAFLPEQRSIFVMQHLTQWLTSDDEAVDDLPEEVEARICLLFAELAPIVQARPGAHWNSIFDMIANNLEVCARTFSDPLQQFSADRSIGIVLFIVRRIYQQSGVCDLDLVGKGSGAQPYKQGISC